jgi:hypothetical protein
MNTASPRKMGAVKLSTPAREQVSRLTGADVAAAIPGQPMHRAGQPATGHPRGPVLHSGATPQPDAPGRCAGGCAVPHSRPLYPFSGPPVYFFRLQTWKGGAASEGLVRHGTTRPPGRPGFSLTAGPPADWPLPAQEWQRVHSAARALCGWPVELGIHPSGVLCGPPRLSRHSCRAPRAPVRCGCRGSTRTAAPTPAS